MKLKFKEGKPNNIFPDCVTIKIHGEFQSTKENLFWETKEIPNLELKLTFRFGQHNHNLVVLRQEQKVTFGIAAGTLVLKCWNVEFPEEERGFSKNFLVEYDFYENKEESTTIKKTSSIEFIKSLFKFRQENTNNRKRAFSYNNKRYQAWYEGTETEPIIRFECDSSICPILDGTKKQEKVGIAKILDFNNWSIEFYFKINKQDIKIIKYKGRKLEELSFFEKLFFNLLVRGNALNQIDRKTRSFISYAKICQLSKD
jgi:hypothetical protein